MVKKVIAGILLTSLMGFLVAGAVNRTQATAGQSGESYSQGRERNDTGQGAGSQGRNSAQGTGSQGKGSTQGAGTQGKGSTQGAGSQGKGSTQGAGAQGEGSTGQQGSQGQNQQGRGGQSGGGESAGQAIANDWLQLEGVVSAADTDLLTVDLDSGMQLIIEGRAWAFAQEQGLSLYTGDRVRLAGFYEDGEFKAGQIENLTNPQTVSLRDTSGRPLWAGGGRWGE